MTLIVIKLTQRRIAVIIIIIIVAAAGRHRTAGRVTYS